MGRLLSFLMAIGFFVSGSLKVLLCLPRPPSPPVLELATEDRDWYDRILLKYRSATYNNNGGRGGYGGYPPPPRGPDSRDAKRLGDGKFLERFAT
jgi:hypothetical protein